MVTNLLSLSYSAADELPTDSFAQYGILGIVTVMLIVFARMAITREMKRADRLETELRELNKLIQERHVPALEAATKALQESTKAVLEIQAQSQARWDYESHHNHRQGL